MQKYAVLWNNAQSFTAKPHVEVINKLNSQIIDNYFLKSRSVVPEYYQSRQVISTALYINICRKKKHEVDLIDNSKREFTLAILFSRLWINSSEIIVSQSDHRQIITYST